MTPRAALLLSLLMLAGCGGSTAINSPSASPSPTQSATASPGLATAGPRSSAAAAYDETSRQVILFGGEGPPTTNAAFDYLGDTWGWDGRSWAHEPGTGPSARFGAAMAFDGARGQAVLFGGLASDNVSGETWTRNGHAWMLRHPAVSPPARQFASMVYDSTRRVVVLFGGQASSILSDTWTWDGSTWTQRHPARSPMARISAAMTYDASRERVVLFGGDPGVGQAFSGGYGDTWTWDGANWSQIAPQSNPPSRVGAALVYDAAVGKSVLFGGLSGAPATLMNDTWTWDGAHWAQLRPVASPPPRLDASMAYDTAHRVLVLYGGSSASPGLNPYLGDTWVWDGVTWSQRG